MAEKTGAIRRLADRLAVESEPGLSTAQLMVRLRILAVPLRPAAADLPNS